MSSNRKKILLLVIDALTERFIDPLLDSGYFPHLAQLRSAAEVVTSCYSIFPSITHAALTSISTGRYPREHGILGSHWYRAAANEFAYYSADFELVLKEGIASFLTQFFTKLNDEHLQADTIFQQLSAAGLTGTSINFLSFCGPHPHQIALPALLKLVPGLTIDRETVYGPDQLLLGEIIDVDIDDIDPLPLDPLRWFGLRDEGTMTFLQRLIAQNRLSNFNVAYFPHNDKRAHDRGPETAHQQLVDLDQMLGELVAEAGGLEQLLAETIIMVTGDHSQSHVYDSAADAAVDLNSLLDRFAIAPSMEPWGDDHQLMICPNMRSAVVYAKPDVATADLFEPLLADSRIDQLSWRDGDGRLHIKTAAAHLTFWPGNQVRDRFGNGWDWRGDLAAVDGHIAGKTIEFGSYPNAFERLAGVLTHPDSGRLWITARPGSELVVSLTSAHLGGGSHGSLHRLDSIAPLWIAGWSAPAGQVPQPARLIDIAPLALNYLTAEPTP